MAFKAKVWVLNNIPSGLPKESDFTCLERELPPCENGDIIVQAEILSVDPYMRYRMRQISVNEVLPGSQVSKVIESRNDKFPVGCYIIGYPGWRTHTHLTSQQLAATDTSSSWPYMKLPNLGEIPRSTSLGVLGMPGNTAYFGFLEICQPKEGETVLVNAAAGAVGSIVCQIALIKGCKVVAFAGSDEKVSWLRDLGVEFAFNYKTCDVSASIREAAPDGVNCYFDNVGGELTSQALPQMATLGRVAICGCIATYNDPRKDIGVPSLTSPLSESTLLWKQLKVEGFIVTRWKDRWEEGITQLTEYLLQGKLKFRETITKGFENMPTAFIDLFHGKNFGKAIVMIKQS